MAIWGGGRGGSGLETVQSAGGVVPFGEWVHLALVADRDAGTLVLYVNGEAQATRNIRATDNNNTDDPLFIAHYTQAEGRSEEHTSELQSLMRISYAVFCLKKKRQYIETDKVQVTDTDKQYQHLTTF